MLPKEKLRGFLDSLWIQREAAILLLFSVILYIVFAVEEATLA
jgi:hypothetical protein